jgi:hypothetical protein
MISRRGAPPGWPVVLTPAVRSALEAQPQRVVVVEQVLEGLLDMLGPQP